MASLLALLGGAAAAASLANLKLGADLTELSFAPPVSINTALDGYRDFPSMVMGFSDNVIALPWVPWDPDVHSGSRGIRGNRSYLSLSTDSAATFCHLHERQRPGHHAGPAGARPMVALRGGRAGVGRGLRSVWPLATVAELHRLRHSGGQR